MKKTITLFIFCIIALNNINVFSQESDLIYNAVKMSRLTVGQSPSLRLATVQSSKQNPDSIISYDNFGNPFEKEICRYDENGNQTLKEFYQWDDYDRVWEPEDRTITQYDAYNNPEREVYYYWSGTGWVYDGEVKNTSVFYNNGRLDSLIMAEYDERSNLMSIGKFVYTYNENGQNIENTMSAYYNGTWIEAMRISYTYDEISGMLLSDSLSIFDGDEEDLWESDPLTFIPFEKNNYEYDRSNRLVVLETYEWMIIGNQWIGQERKVFTNDPVLDRRTKAEVYDWNDDADNWNTRSIGYDTYYYPSDLTSIRSVQQQAVSKAWCYGETLYVKCESDVQSINIYNLSGTLIHSHAVGGSNIILATEFPKGIYLARLTFADGRTEVVKFRK